MLAAQIARRNPGSVLLHTLMICCPVNLLLRIVSLLNGEQNLTQNRGRFRGAGQSALPYTWLFSAVGPSEDGTLPSTVGNPQGQVRQSQPFDRNLDGSIERLLENSVI